MYFILPQRHHLLFISVHLSPLLQLYLYAPSLVGSHETVIHVPMASTLQETHGFNLVNFFGRFGAGLPQIVVQKVEYRLY